VTFDDPSWKNKVKDGVKVGDQLKKKWSGKWYDVKVIEIYQGEMFRLRFDKMDATSDLWIKPGNPKLTKI